MNENERQAYRDACRKFLPFLLEVLTNPAVVALLGSDENPKGPQLPDWDEFHGWLRGIAVSNVGWVDSYPTPVAATVIDHHKDGTADVHHLQWKVCAVTLQGKQGAFGMSPTRLCGEPLPCKFHTQFDQKIDSEPSARPLYAEKFSKPAAPDDAKPSPAKEERIKSWGELVSDLSVFNNFSYAEQRANAFAAKKLDELGWHYSFFTNEWCQPAPVADATNPAGYRPSSGPSIPQGADGVGFRRADDAEPSHHYEYFIDTKAMYDFLKSDKPWSERPKYEPTPAPDSTDAKPEAVVPENEAGERPSGVVVEHQHKIEDLFYRMKRTALTVNAEAPLQSAGEFNDYFRRGQYFHAVTYKVVPVPVEIDNSVAGVRSRTFPLFDQELIDSYLKGCGLKPASPASPAPACNEVWFPEYLVPKHEYEGRASLGSLHGECVRCGGYEFSQPHASPAPTPEPVKRMTANDVFTIFAKGTIMECWKYTPGPEWDEIADRINEFFGVKRDVYSAAFCRRLKYNMIAAGCIPSQIECVLLDYPQDPDETTVNAQG